MEPGDGRERARARSRELRDSIRRIVDIARDLRLFASPPAPASGAARHRRRQPHRRVRAHASRAARSSSAPRSIRSLDEVPPVLMDDGRLGPGASSTCSSTPRRRSRGSYGARAPRHGRDAQRRAHRRDRGRATPASASPRRTWTRIWQPFFTTKARTSAPASASRSAARSSSAPAGPSSVESPRPRARSARGARASRISLPAAGTRSTWRRRSRRRCPRVPARAVRVLIVEDEAALGRALAEEIGASPRRRRSPAAPRRALAAPRRSASTWCSAICACPGCPARRSTTESLERDPAQARGVRLHDRRRLRRRRRALPRRRRAGRCWRSRSRPSGALDAIVRVLNRRLRAASRS